MIYEGDLSILTNMWKERMQSPKYDAGYKDALRDCIYEMDSLIESLLEPEEDIQRYLDEQNADAYLSTIEAHEHYS